MTHRPLVSVIVPAKDQAPYISDALASLALQFDDPAALEVLVVDDGSTDGTGGLAASFADRLPGLRVLRNESPVGLATARNQGLDAAASGYIAYLDGDDWLAPDIWRRALIRCDGWMWTSSAPITSPRNRACAPWCAHRRPAAGSPWTPGSRSCRTGNRPWSTTRSHGPECSSDGSPNADCCAFPTA